MKPPPPGYNRDLLARLEREEQRLRDDASWERSNAEAEAAAQKIELDLRSRGGGNIPADAVRVVLPANADPLAPRDPSRRAAFIRNLTEAAEEAVLDRGRIQPEPAEAAAPADGRETLTVQACTACRGNCCRAGGDHAYLAAETLARTLDAHPDWNLARVLDAYLERLPAESYRDSCIYHGPAGCGLPRTLRSSTCNRYLCAGLSKLRADLPAVDLPPVLAVLFDHGRWTRAALLDDRGVRILSEAPPEKEGDAGNL